MPETNDIEEGFSGQHLGDELNYSGVSCASTPVKSRGLSNNKSMSLTNNYEAEGYSDQRVGDEPVTTGDEESLLRSPSPVKSSGLSQDIGNISMVGSNEYDARAEYELFIYTYVSAGLSWGTQLSVILQLFEKVYKDMKEKGCPALILRNLLDSLKDQNNGKLEFIAYFNLLNLNFRLLY